ncbi:MAG TPA: hypothetical protein DCE41_32440 [Cytophagales bacterium]|nr:hypothetical protein [Cytophagales bacterium]HAA19298.1 hypothetical protein [Cytophagales bacterium]HAP64821.1 hypothetical protein [Cytophagales bacterium]
MSVDKVKDSDRIEEIARLRLHEDEVDVVLNKYVQEASREFNLPIGLVSIVLDDVQKFAASEGLKGWIAETQGTPVEWAFCAHSVRSGEPFIVEDSEKNHLVKESPLTTMEGIKCYAGAPLISSRGYVLGNFCVMGEESRSFSTEEVAKLKDYAAKAMAHIESRAAEPA